MRYVGQVHECTVDIGTFDINEKTIEKVKEAFHKRHDALYTYSERHNAVEVVNIESTAYGRIEKPKLPKYGKGASAKAALKGYRKAIFDVSGKATKTPIYDGDVIGVGAKIAGPAIIEEVTTTIVIEPGWSAVLDATGSYVISRKR
jgi:N-methylhydantoinase A